MSESRKFLVHIDLGRTVSVSEIQVIVDQLRGVLARAANGQAEFAYRSINLDIMGFFIQSGLVAGQIMARLEAPGDTRQRGTMGCAYAGAKIMVVELGSGHSFGPGMTALGAWFQHH